MLKHARFLALLGCVLWLGDTSAYVRAQYSGAFVDGTLFAGLQETDLFEPKARPKRPGAVPAAPPRPGAFLFDPEKPPRWLRNESAELPAAATMYVEFFGGDRLPGRVVEFRSGTETLLDRLPPHFLVRPGTALNVSSWPAREFLRVKSQCARKIVWQARHGDRYTPSTLYFLDGRQLEYRSLRWNKTGVNLLTKEGDLRGAGFDEIAELHLPRQDPWRAYYETLACLNPDCTSRLMRLETTGGLRATTSLDRLLPEGEYHVLQTAWCLDPLAVPYRQVPWRRFFLPWEVPLSALEPVRCVERSLLQGFRTWQADRNVKREPLRSGERAHGWGLGTHAYCELEFELPDWVRAFRTRVGLDDDVDRGGCARGLVYLNRVEGKPLWQSNLLVGSREIADMGSVPLAGPTRGQKTLILVADPAHAERPAGADPFNIRDMVDWLEPLLELDAGKVRAEVYRLFPKTVPAWQDWTATTREGERLNATFSWGLVVQPPRHYRMETGMRSGALVLSRRATPTPEQNYLCLAVSRQPAGPLAPARQPAPAPLFPSWIEVRIDGKPAAQFEVPDRQPNVEPAHFLVPMQPYQGKALTVEVEHYPAGPGSVLQWRFLDFVKHPDLIAWVPLEVVEASSTGATNLLKEPEHTLFAQNKVPNQVPASEAYTIVADSDLREITALRLELLRDGRLPHSGPGRSDGHVFLSDFRVKAAPRNQPAPAEAVVLSAAAADFFIPGRAAAATIDDLSKTGWLIVARAQSHAIVFTTRDNIGFPGGTRFTITLDHKPQARHSIGCFRLSAACVDRPVPSIPPGVRLPAAPRRYLVLFEDEPHFLGQVNLGKGSAVLEPGDKYSGTASVKVTGPERGNPKSLGALRIRRRPAPGEYRFLRFAWKKPDGQAVCLQLAHDGFFGPLRDPRQADLALNRLLVSVPPVPSVLSIPNATAFALSPLLECCPSFRYHAGPGPLSHGAALKIDAHLPRNWTLVTRDLYADFGEFTLTGLSLDPIDGSAAFFDHIRLGRTLDDMNVEADGGKGLEASPTKY